MLGVDLGGFGHCAEALWRVFADMGGGAGVDKVQLQIWIRGFWRVFDTAGGDIGVCSRIFAIGGGGSRAALTGKVPSIYIIGAEVLDIGQGSM